MREFFMREYLGKVKKEDHCIKFFEDIRMADQLVRYLGATFQGIRKTALKFTVHKCHFGATEIDLGRTIAPAGVKPQRPRGQTFWKIPSFRNPGRHFSDTWVS